MCQRRAGRHRLALDRARRSTTTVVPILGARTAAQLADGLAARALELPQESVDQLESASAIVLGEPHDQNAFHAGLDAGNDFRRPPLVVA